MGLYQAKGETSSRIARRGRAQREGQTSTFLAKKREGEREGRERESSLRGGIESDDTPDGVLDLGPNKISPSGAHGMMLRTSPFESLPFRHSASLY